MDFGLKSVNRGSEIQNMIAPELLNYNKNWEMIDEMLDKCMSEDFRQNIKDDFGGGWVYSWHCIDHVDYDINRLIPIMMSCGVKSA